MTSTAQAEAKREYRRNLEMGFIAALALMIAMFLFFPRPSPETAGGDLPAVTFFFTDESSEIPQPVDTDGPRVPVLDLVEEVREVETPFPLPVPDRAAAARPASAAPAENLEDYDFPPRPRDMVRPEYPEVARLSGAEGLVRLRVVVGPSGLVEDAWIVDAELPQFGESALRAVRGWTFLPAVRNGRPVRASIVLPIQFVLTEAERAG
jgi:protein TonB